MSELRVLEFGALVFGALFLGCIVTLGAWMRTLMEWQAAQDKAILGLLRDAIKNLEVQK